MIELQKGGVRRLTSVYGGHPWLETETLRFRQYLGVHYSNPKNMSGDHALPTIAIYLLGHKVGDIEEPVLYVRHQSFDYDGKLVTKGLPNAFIDSLTHDSIIVQIPRLHGQVNNRLDKVLSIFDQSRRDKDNEHILRFDEATYRDDADMEPILHRLTMAAADADMRQSMNVEDEYYSIIERRDTELMVANKQLAEQKEQLEEKEVQLKDLLHTSVLSLHKAGLSIDAIASALNRDIETIKTVLEEA